MSGTHIHTVRAVCIAASLLAVSACGEQQQAQNAPADSATQQTTGLRLVRFGDVGAEKPGLIDASGTLRDLSGVIADFTPDNLSPDALAKLKALDASTLPEVSGNPRLGVPLTGIGKILAAGYNYKAHAAEMNVELPKEPLIFNKATTALTGPNDPIVMPKDAVKVDWEVELGVVIGTQAQYVSEADALNYVAGYTVCWDGSERAWQNERGGQYVKGKSADTFAPLGPWILTADAVPNPQDLDLWLDVNGQRMQESNTNYMIFGVATLISHVSSMITLAPGDVICTGTPEGVGDKRTPPVYLKAGDSFKLSVEGLGEQTHTVEAYRATR